MLAQKADGIVSPMRGIVIPVQINEIAAPGDFFTPAAQKRHTVLGIQRLKLLKRRTADPEIVVPGDRIHRHLAGKCSTELTRRFQIQKVLVVHIAGENDDIRFKRFNFCAEFRLPVSESGTMQIGYLDNAEPVK